MALFWLNLPYLIFKLARYTLKWLDINLLYRIVDDIWVFSFEKILNPHTLGCCFLGWCEPLYETTYEILVLGIRHFVLSIDVNFDWKKVKIIILVINSSIKITNLCVSTYVRITQTIPSRIISNKYFLFYFSASGRSRMIIITMICLVWEYMMHIFHTGRYVFFLLWEFYMTGRNFKLSHNIKYNHQFNIAVRARTYVRAYVIFHNTVKSVESV